jgi:hypothetical protein
MSRIVFALSDFIRCVVTARNLDLWSETGQVKTRKRPEEAARRIPPSDPSGVARCGLLDPESSKRHRSLIPIKVRPLKVVEPARNVGKGWLAFAVKPLIFEPTYSGIQNANLEGEPKLRVSLGGESLVSANHFVRDTVFNVRSACMPNSAFIAVAVFAMPALTEPPIVVKGL